MKFQFNPLVKEIPSIGLLRGIASVMVCYFHLAHENPRLLPPESIIKQSGAWGWTGVQVFFIISGFVIPYSMFVNQYKLNKAWIFLKKRIIRIEPPYLISIVIVLLLNYVSALMPSYKGQPFAIDWSNVAGHIAYLNIFTGNKWLLDVYWTLAVEFQYYLLIAALYGLVVSKNILFRLSFFSVFIGMMLLNIPAKGFIMPFTGYFMTGILLFQYYCGIIRNKEFWISMVVCMIALVYLQGWQMAVLSSVAGCMIAFVKNVPSVFRFLGMISFSLYLIHIPVGGRINNLAAGLINNLHIKEAVVFLSFSASIFAAWLFYLTVEKKFKRLSAAVKFDTAQPTFLKQQPEL